MHFPLKLKNLCLPQLFPIIYDKSITENQILKNFVHFLTRSDLSKVYYITHLREIKLLRKSDFFQIFYYKTMYNFQK